MSGDLGGDDSRYFSQLDSLRALAVLSVMWSHWMPHEYLLRLPWGQVGVQLFFVLSGFLITGILVRARESLRPRATVLKAFYVRRALRIVPVYYLLLLVLYWLDFDTTRPTIAWHVTFATNGWIVWFNSYASWLAHFWSLAVEEQFYLLWPFAVLFLPRWMVVQICYALMVIACVSRGYLGFFHSDHITDVLLLANADALACGALLALAPSGTTASIAKPEALRFVFVVFVITQLFVLIQYDHWLETVRRTCMILCCGWIVFRAAVGVKGAVGRVLSNKLLRGIGKLSYAMYLLHNFMIPTWLYWRPHMHSQLVSWLDYSPLLRAASMFAIVVVLALVSRVLIEEPCLRLKSRFRY